MNHNMYIRAKRNLPFFKLHFSFPFGFSLQGWISEDIFVNDLFVKINIHRVPKMLTKSCYHESWHSLSTVHIHFTVWCPCSVSLILVLTFCSHVFLVNGTDFLQKANSITSTEFTSPEFYLLFAQNLIWLVCSCTGK